MEFATAAASQEPYRRDHGKLFYSPKSSIRPHAKISNPSTSPSATKSRPAPPT